MSVATRRGAKARRLPAPGLTGVGTGSEWFTATDNQRMARVGRTGVSWEWEAWWPGGYTRGEIGRPGYRRVGGLCESEWARRKAWALALDALRRAAKRA